MSTSTELYARRKAAGLCPYCAGPRDRSDRVHCIGCRERYKGYDRKRDLDPVRRLSKVEGNRNLRASDPQKYRDISNASRQRLREEVYAAYGSVCVCCGEDNWLFLTLDHTLSDGAAHRRELTKRKSRRQISPDTMMRWARSNDYPNTLQLLCFNCNCGRQRNKGRCPHRDQIEEAA